MPRHSRTNAAGAASPVAGLGILPLTILLNIFGDSVLTLTAWNWVWLVLGALAVLGWVLARRHAKAGRGA